MGDNKVKDKLEKLKAKPGNEFLASVLGNSRPPMGKPIAIPKRLPSLDDYDRALPFGAVRRKRRRDED